MIRVAAVLLLLRLVAGCATIPVPDPWEEERTGTYVQDDFTTPEGKWWCEDAAFPHYGGRVVGNTCVQPDGTVVR